MLKLLPEDINIEDLLAYLTKGTYKISIDGLHKRNSYFDIVNYYEDANGNTNFHIGRNSLYNILPEYMFHTVNRFDNIREIERKEKFAEEYAKQEAEKENAHKFFAPLDALLLDLKVKTKETLIQYSSENKIMEDIIGDTLTKEERNNRFIKHVIPFLPQCKNIRGNKTLITLLLRKVLYEEGLILRKEDKRYDLKDESPKYECNIDEGEIDSLYVGNKYDQKITTYTILYWSEDDCNENFKEFLNDIDCFKKFMQDYFFSIEEIITFQIVTDAPTLRLSDDIIHNYLNYNTNI